MHSDSVLIESADILLLEKKCMNMKILQPDEKSHLLWPYVTNSTVFWLRLIGRLIWNLLASETEGKLNVS